MEREFATNDEIEEPETEAQAAMRSKHAAIMAIMLDSTLTETEKAQKRQLLMMGTWAKEPQGVHSVATGLITHSIQAGGLCSCRTKCASSRQCQPAERELGEPWCHNAIR